MGTQHAHLGWGSEIAYPGYPNDMRRNELERFEPFARHRIFEANKSGDIPARTRQAFDKSGSYRIEGPHRIGIAITTGPLDCPTEGPSAQRQVRADLPELSPPRPRPIIP